ncbi:MAG: sensor hybrid histidine kinase [Fibrobacteres bacterium]|nr:sensor hybrid histidine kinase [Fibrobacterota bacterium]
MHRTFLLKPNILVVDDEQPVRELIALFLETSGYTVYQAEGGHQALNLVADPGIMVDILVTDIIMPYMHGRELANRICSIRPHIKVLFVSAYSAQILSNQNLCPDGADYIRKPFGKALLLQRISKVWDTGPKWKELTSP